MSQEASISHHDKKISHYFVINWVGALNYSLIQSSISFIEKVALINETNNEMI